MSSNSRLESNKEEEEGSGPDLARRLKDVKEFDNAGMVDSPQDRDLPPEPLHENLPAIHV